jgi:LysM domain-containing protein
VYDDPAADPNPHAPSGPRPVASKLLTRASKPPAPLSSLDHEAEAAFGRASSASGEPGVCPYLRAIDDQDRLLLPVLSPDPVNRCAAMGEAVPQSLRQQELVCLTSGHLNCPRYQRASAPVPVTAAIAEAATTVTRTVRITARPIAVTPATAGALAVFLVAFAISLGFMLANGGLALSEAPTPAPSAGVLGEVETAAPHPTPAHTPIATSTPAPAVTPRPTATAAVVATPIPSPTPAATPAATARPTSRPTSGRYALLRPCPDQADCWIYRVRSGDNLYSIARYFGVPLKTVQAWNPWTASGLKVGRDLRIPPPTR